MGQELPVDADGAPQKLRHPTGEHRVTPDQCQKFAVSVMSAVQSAPVAVDFSGLRERRIDAPMQHQHDRANQGISSDSATNSCCHLRVVRVN
jgi:hypothetical protein